MKRFLSTAAAIALSAGLTTTPSHAAGVTEEMLANDQAMTDQITTNGMGRHLQRYSPLETLNKGNVDNLVPGPGR
ncbi:MAG: PQQ-dependent dehydrogenase, methanol/ethanol family, partial [Pseudomonadota bacterium]